MYKKRDNFKLDAGRLRKKGAVKSTDQSSVFSPLSSSLFENGRDFMAKMFYLGIWRSQIQGGVRQVENDATFP